MLWANIFIEKLNSASLTTTDDNFSEISLARTWAGRTLWQGIDLRNTEGKGKKKDGKNQAAQRGQL
jgi:hypothetical protein